MESIDKPRVRKNVQFPFQVSIALWCDLLGYGAMMAKAEFNPLDEMSKKGIRRLRTFHKIVAESSNRNFPTLVVNDGAAAYRDLSLRSQSNSEDFIKRAWELFKRINAIETRNLCPGIRMVVACGFRVRGRKATVEKDNIKLKSIIRKVNQGKLTAHQAINEAFMARPSFDIVPQLQGNFAFTKAYVAESSGRSGGLHGPNFYLDLALLHRPVSRWPIFHDSILWKNEKLRLSACFGKIEDIPVCKDSQDGASYVRNGLQVAQELVGEVDVLEALRSAKKVPIS